MWPCLCCTAAQQVPQRPAPCLMEFSVPVLAALAAFPVVPGTWHGVMSQRVLPVVHGPPVRSILRGPCVRAVGLTRDPLGALAAQAAQPVGAEDQRRELLAALRFPEQDAGEVTGMFLASLCATWGMVSASPCHASLHQ